MEFTMFDKITLKLAPSEQKAKEELFELIKERYKDYKDPWGFDLDTVKKALDFTYPLYKKYFKVRVFGQENIKDEPYMVVSNHTGQIPIDGVLITLAFAFDSPHPRILHTMIERFMAALPFLGDFSARAGSILGDRENCKWLLDKGESILVFPEGVRGINKSTKDFYKLQKFSNGFYRIAGQSKTKILPISVVGAEEMFPLVFQAGGIGKKFGLPSLPLPTNLIPLPAPIDIYIGEPYEIPDDFHLDAPDKEIRPHILNIENRVKEGIELGLKNRRDFFDKIRKPLNRIMKKF